MFDHPSQHDRVYLLARTQFDRDRDVIGDHGYFIFSHQVSSDLARGCARIQDQYIPIVHQLSSNLGDLFFLQIGRTDAI